jgi:hypothetical protein
VALLPFVSVLAGDRRGKGPEAPLIFLNFCLFFLSHNKVQHEFLVLGDKSQSWDNQYSQRLRALKGGDGAKRGGDSGQIFISARSGARMNL